MMERAFTGFTALPDQTGDAWWEALGVGKGASPALVEAMYRKARSAAHPDKGGSDAEFDRVKKAWNAYLREAP